MQTHKINFNIKLKDLYCFWIDHRWLKKASAWLHSPQSNAPTNEDMHHHSSARTQECGLGWTSGYAWHERNQGAPKWREQLVVLVPRTNRSTKFCVYFRKVSGVFTLDVYPMAHVKCGSLFFFVLSQIVEGKKCPVLYFSCKLPGLCLAVGLEAEAWPSNSLWMLSEVWRGKQ